MSTHTNSSQRGPFSLVADFKGQLGLTLTSTCCESICIACSEAGICIASVVLIMNKVMLGVNWPSMTL